MRVLLDYDPFTGIETWWEKEPGSDKASYIYQPTRDVSAEVDHCKRLANDTEYTRRGIKEDWWHYAHIPCSVMLKWYVEEGIPLYDAHEYNKKVNERDYRDLKVTQKWHDLK